MTTRFDRRIVLALPLIAIAAAAGWLMLPSSADTSPDLTLNLAVATPEAPETAAPPSASSTSPPDAADLGRISLVRQSFRRGGLGSRALMTFTVRNANAYDIKDLEILCAFRSRDGRYTTERRRVLADTIGPKRRKEFPLTHIGHINVKAEQARCSPVMASRA